MDIFASARMSLGDTIGMIVGVALGAVTLFYLFAGPILWFRRRFFYDKTPTKYYDKLLTTDFYNFVTGQLQLGITADQLITFLEYEHKHFKNRNFESHGGTGSARAAASIVEYTGSRNALAKKMSKEFPSVTHDHAYKIMRLEDKYLRRFYPWWQKLV